jgi:hypothetical protein
MRIGIGLGIGRSGGNGPTDAQRIAREAISPTRINTWHVFGSSRTTGAHVYLQQNCDLIPWSGVALAGVGYSTVGMRCTGVTKAGGLAPTTSTEIGGTQNWFPQNCGEVVSLGVSPSTTIHANRIAATEFTPALFPFLWARLPSATVRGRGTFYRHAGGVDCSSDPSTYWGPRLYIPMQTANQWAYGDGTAAPYTTDTTGSGYGYAETTIAAGAAWSTPGMARVNWNVDPGRQAFPTGQILAIDHAVLSVDLPGAVIVNYSAGGASMPRWTMPEIIADACFSELMPLKGPNPLCFFEGGWFTGADNYAAVAAVLDATIGRFQLMGTDVPTIIHTGYPSNLSDGLGPDWHNWIEQWCRSTPYRVLFLPTHNVRTYAANVALGFYSLTETPGDEGDGVHAGPLGQRTFAADIQALILAAV